MSVLSHCGDDLYHALEYKYRYPYLLTGRCYEAEMCAFLFLLRCLSDEIVICQSQNFMFQAENHGL